MKSIQIIGFIITLLIVFIPFNIIDSTDKDYYITSLNQSEEYVQSSEEIKEYYDKEKLNVNSDIIFPLLIEFVGAFLAVTSALILDSKMEKKKYKSLNKELYNELKSINKELSQRLKNDSYEYFRYLTPVWNIHMESGNLQLITKMINKDYIEIYKTIQYAQEIELEYFHCKFLYNNHKISNIDSNSKESNEAENYVLSSIEALNKERNNLLKIISDKIIALGGQNICQD